MHLRLSTPLVLALVAVGAVFLSGLGAWQLQRNAEKQDLEADRAAAIAAPPIDAVEAGGMDGEAVDFRRVHAAGRWDHDQTVTISNRVRAGTLGEEIVTPLILEDGTAVLVNRGWAPLEARDQVLSELESEPVGEVVGLAGIDALSAREIRPGVWSRYSVGSIGATLPYVVAPWRLTEGELRDVSTLVPGGELPVTGYAGYESTTPHMQYALTWFGLAAALVATGVVRVVQERRTHSARRAASTAQADA